METVTKAELDALDAELPREIYNCRGQLSHYDRILYYWAGCRAYSGIGTVVDAGALIGGTAKLLAYGLTQNPHAADARILSYDRFEDVADGYMAKAIGAFPGVSLPTPADGKIDFEPIFRANVQAFSHLIEVKRGDITAIGYHEDAPIEILSVDVGKTPDLMIYIAREFFPHLVPGKSLVLNQDYIFPHQPWVIMAMELLADRFEVICEPPAECTMVHRCIAPITPELVKERMGEFGRDYFKLTNVGLIPQARKKLREIMNRATLQAAESYALSSLGQFYAAQNAARALLSDYAITPDTFSKRPALKRIFDELGLPIET